MPAGKTLYLHTGGSKAGSSALQNFLNFNRLALAEVDMAYLGAPPSKSTYTVTSGNGRHLFDALIGGLDDDDRILTILRGFFNKRKDAMISREHFEGLGEDHWRRLIAIAARDGVRIHIIVLVRNTLPLLLASYDQALRGTGESRSFEAWAPKAKLNIYDHLRVVHALGDAVDVTVLSFDRCRDTLAATVLAVAGIDLNALTTPLVPIGTVNRSLVPDERRLLREVNAAFGARFSRAVSAMFLKERPELKAEFHWTKDNIRLAEERFGADVAWVNATFFGGRPETMICSDEDRLTAVEPVAEGEAAVTADSLLRKWLFETMDGEYSRLTTHLAIVRTMERPDHPDLPADFDPVIYILMHDELRQTRQDPYRHYLSFGKAAGRPYKIDL